METNLPLRFSPSRLQTDITLHSPLQNTAGGTETWQVLFRSFLSVEATCLACQHFCPCRSFLCCSHVRLERLISPAGAAHLRPLATEPQRAPRQ